MTEPSGLRFVNLRAEWADVLAYIERTCFPTIDSVDLYNADELRDLAHDFPDGGYVVLDGDTPIAMGLGIRVDFDFNDCQHSILNIGEPDGGTGHDPHGTWYYGTSIAVLPDYRRRGIGRRLYELRKDVCRRLNLAGIVADGVIPGYADHKHHMTAEEYVHKVASGDIYDRTLSVQIANGFEVRGVVSGTLTDPTVDSWASLIVWDNTDYTPPTDSLNHQPVSPEN